MFLYVQNLLVNLFQNDTNQPESTSKFSGICVLLNYVKIIVTRAKVNGACPKSWDSAKRLTIINTKSLPYRSFCRVKMSTLFQWVKLHGGFLRPLFANIRTYYSLCIAV